MDLDLNTENLNEISGYLDLINEELSTLSTSMNGINFDGIELSSASLFNDTKTAIENIVNGGYSSESISQLKERIDSTRILLESINDDIGQWYKEIDEFSFGEFGDFNDFIEEVSLDENKDNSGLEEYLRSKFGNFVKLENGGYCVKNAKGEVFYFSEDCIGNDNVKFVAYYPGASGDLNYICPAIEQYAIPSGTVIALSNTPTDGTWGTSYEYNTDYKTSLFGQFDIISSDLGINATTVQTIGFSSGGTSAMSFARMNQYLRLHPEVENTSIVVVDGGDQAKISSEHEPFPIDELVKNKVPVYLISSGSAQGNGTTYASLNEKAAKMLSEYGLDTYILAHNDVIIHQNMNEKLFSSTLYRFLSGETEQLGNINPADYTVYRYNNGDSSIVDDLFWNGGIVKESPIPETEPVEEILDDESPILEEEPLEEINDEDAAVNLNFEIPNDNVFGIIYNQNDPIYRDIPYNKGNLSTNGCGFFSLLSVITAKTGYEFSYDEIKDLANNVQTNCIGKANNERMEYLADHLSDTFNFEWKKGPVDEVSSSLKNGKAVIALTPWAGSSSGHFVPITGILENNNVIINDTNGTAYHDDPLYQERINSLGFNLEQGEFKITPSCVDQNGDGLNDDVWYFEFKGSSLSSEGEQVFPKTEPIAPETKPINNEEGLAPSNYNEVPLYYQQDYADVPYGNYGTVSTHGCGIASLSMVASYLLNKQILPDELANKYGSYNTSGGSDWALFTDSAKDLGLNLTKEVYYSTENEWNEVVDALKEGNVVIANARSNSIFTNNGHYVVLTGITEDGKILVNDPNKYNHEEFGYTVNPVLSEGFKNGFEQKEFMYGKVTKFWIYEKSQN